LENRGDLHAGGLADPRQWTSSVSGRVSEARKGAARDVDGPSWQVRLVAMKTILLLSALVSLVSLGLFAQNNSGPAGPKGKLIVVGGGGTTDEIIARAFALAGGKEARILIVPQAA